MRSNTIKSGFDRDLKPRDIIDRTTIMNAFALDTALAGSTNTARHTLAIAHEAGIDFALEDLNERVVKAGAVDKKMLNHSGPARIYESQKEASAGIMHHEVQPGDVVVIPYEGPKGGPGMPVMVTSAHTGAVLQLP